MPELGRVEVLDDDVRLLWMQARSCDRSWLSHHDVGWAGLGGQPGDVADAPVAYRSLVDGAMSVN
jgi:hypothetical protein